MSTTGSPLSAIASVTGLPVGLTSEEASRRLAQTGLNTVAENRKSIFRRIAAHFWAPVPWMLEFAILLQLAMGERLEAAMIAALLIFNIGLGFFQEGRADAALALLKKQLSLKAQVRRDGEWTELPAELLVPEDIVRLSLGTVVPADVQILDGSVLLDQSMLTGESVPVEVDSEKRAYASALVRRGEAVGVVTATGSSTYFGRTAELVSDAHVESSEVKAVLGLVRNLSVLNAIIVIGLVTYAHAIGLPALQIMLLVLTALLSAVPVALPATFTLASTLGARTLAKQGVLLTRLTALQEAAMIDVLCADKTGTLTSNVLAVTAVRSLAEGWTTDDVLAFAALASSSSQEDPIDTAVRQAAQRASPKRAIPVVLHFTPFDPTTKRAEAAVQGQNGDQFLITKGAPAAVATLLPFTREIEVELNTFSQAGYRTLAIASGSSSKMTLIGLIAFSDLPRTDSPQLLTQLRSLGVQTVMVTGDAPPTAAAVARSIGLTGRICLAGQIPDDVKAEDFAVYAGVFPEDKFRLVKALQHSGHAVGMCGDGVNDAPALRQAQMGIAVSTATDVAKAAAGIVLVNSGLSGIVAAIEEGRAVFQRVLTYAMSIVVNKCVTLAILMAGLVLTKHAVLTPMLQALSMLTNDFVSMARTTDRTTPSLQPNAWRIRNLVLAALPLAAMKFLFCLGVLSVGRFYFHLSDDRLQTLTFIMLVFAGQALIYILRERGRMWRSRPSGTMMLFSGSDLIIVSVFATRGILMQPIPLTLVVTLFIATALFALLLDQVKILAFTHWRVE